MANKENKGGLLSPAEIEQDLKAKGRIDNSNGYSGAQDTGDKGVRQEGTDVQKRDGLAGDEEPEQ